MIDHTNLRAYATQEDFRRLCDEARANHFRSVAINSYPVRMCREMLKGSDVLTGAAIAFPLGQTSMEARLRRWRTRSRMAVRSSIMYSMWAG